MTEGNCIESKMNPVTSGVLLVLLLLLWLPQLEGKPNDLMCARIDPFEMPHEYSEAGDVIIGAIVSLFTCIFDWNFSKDPNTIIINEFM